MAVHVVDNDSGDGTAEMVEREFGQVKLTRAPGNIGFSAANNIAIRESTAPYVLVLNPDTRVTEGALETVCRVLDERETVGIAGPKLVLEDGSFDHAAKRSFPTPVGALAHFTGVGRREGAGETLAQYRAPERDADEAGSVDAVNGAFMLIRRAALEEAGAFDEGYWMYMEDLDLSYRFDEKGWVTWYEPAATVVHVKAGTSGPIRNAKLNRAFHYGMYRFYRKFYAPHRAPILNVVVYAGIWLKLGVSLVRGFLARALRVPGVSEPERPTLPREEIEWIRRTRRHPRPTQPDFLVLRRLATHIARALGRVSGGNGGGLEVLDVFCGTRPYEDLMPQGSKVTGYDIDDRYGSADVTGTDFLPFEGESFDLVFFAEGFFYSPDPREAAAEMLRITRPGGSTIVTLPLVWEYRTDRLEHRFTAPELVRVFESAGWDDVEASEVGGYAVSWALLTGRIMRAVEESARSRSRLGWRLRPLFAAAYAAMNAIAVLAERFERRVWRPAPYTLPPDMILTARKPAP